jgi:hypothetical protein
MAYVVRTALAAITAGVIITTVIVHCLGLETVAEILGDGVFALIAVLCVIPVFWKEQR